MNNKRWERKKRTKYLLPEVVVTNNETEKINTWSKKGKVERKELSKGRKHSFLLSFLSLLWLSNTKDEALKSSSLFSLKNSWQKKWRKEWHTGRKERVIHHQDKHKKIEWKFPYDTEISYKSPDLFLQEKLLEVRGKFHPIKAGNTEDWSSYMWWQT